MKRRSLQGARALVTGSSSGIGRAIALEMARAGADLVITARREAELQQLAEEVRSLGRRCEVVAGSLAERNFPQLLAQEAGERLGGLDILVNNAGLSAHGRFADASPERLRTIMEVNFFAAVELTRAALPLLRGGSLPIVVNIGSILGHRGMPYKREYCSGKFGLGGWSEAIRPEFARIGIDVLLVSPGTTETEFFEHVVERRGEIPWKKRRGVSPEYVARRTVRAIRRGRREIVPSGAGRFLVLLQRLSPRLVDRFMARYG